MARSSLIALLLLSACQTTSPGACPSLVSYSAADIAKADSELKALAVGSELGAMIVDYDGLRRQIRACAAP